MTGGRGRGDARSCSRARRAFRGVFPRGEWIRAVQIAGLLRKRWKGRQLYALTCRADYGKGPHTMFVPEHVLWSLLDLRYYRCAYHNR